MQIRGVSHIVLPLDRYDQAVLKSSGTSGGQAPAGKSVCTAPFTAKAPVPELFKVQLSTWKPSDGSPGHVWPGNPTWVIVPGNPVSIARPAKAGAAHVSLTGTLTLKLAPAGTGLGVTVTLLYAKQQDAPAVTSTLNVLVLSVRSGSVTPGGAVTVAVFDTPTAGVAKVPVMDTATELPEGKVAIV